MPDLSGSQTAGRPSLPASGGRLPLTSVRKEGEGT